MDCNTLVSKIFHVNVHLRSTVQLHADSPHAHCIWQRGCKREGGGGGGEEYIEMLVVVVTKVLETNDKKPIWKPVPEGGCSILQNDLAPGCILSVLTTSVSRHTEQ